MTHPDHPNRLGFIEIEDESDAPDPVRRLLVTRGLAVLAVMSAGLTGFFAREATEAVSPEPLSDEKTEQSIREAVGNRWLTAYAEQQGIAKRYGTAVFPHLHADLTAIGSRQAPAEVLSVYQPEGWGVSPNPESKVAEALRILSHYQFDQFKQAEHYRAIFTAIATTFPGLLIASKPLTIKAVTDSSQRFDFGRLDGVVRIPTHNPIYDDDRLKIHELLNLLCAPFAGGNFSRETMRSLRPYVSQTTLHSFIRLSSMAARELIETDIDDGVFPFTDAIKDFREYGFNAITAESQEVIKYILTAGYESDFINLEDIVYKTDDSRWWYSLYKLREVGAKSLLQLVNTNQKVSSDPTRPIDLVIAQLGGKNPAPPPRFNGLNA